MFVFVVFAFVLLSESKGDLQSVVNEFYSVCKRRKVKVNAGKSKVIVFKSREEEVIDFNTAYKVRVPAVTRFFFFRFFFILFFFCFSFFSHLFCRLFLICFHQFFFSSFFMSSS